MCSENMTVGFVTSRGSQTNFSTKIKCHFLTYVSAHDFLIRTILISAYSLFVCFEILLCVM